MEDPTLKKKTYADYYDDILNRRKGLQSAWHNFKFEVFAEQIEPHARHLDIGCSSGSFIGLLPNTVSSIGIDPDAIAIQHARRKYGSANRQFFGPEKMKRLRDAGARFDVITCIEVIEHLGSSAESVGRTEDW